MRTLNSMESKKVSGSGAGLLVTAGVVDLTIAGMVAYTFYGKNNSTIEADFCPYHPLPNLNVKSANVNPLSPENKATIAALENQVNNHMVIN